MADRSERQRTTVRMQAVGQAGHLMSVGQAGHLSMSALRWGLGRPVRMLALLRLHARCSPQGGRGGSGAGWSRRHLGWLLDAGVLVAVQA